MWKACCHSSDGPSSCRLHTKHQLFSKSSKSLRSGSAPPCKLPQPWLTPVVPYLYIAIAFSSVVSSSWQVSTHRAKGSLPPCSVPSSCFLGGTEKEMLNERINNLQPQVSESQLVKDLGCTHKGHRERKGRRGWLSTIMDTETRRPPLPPQTILRTRETKRCEGSRRDSAETGRQWCGGSLSPSQGYSGTIWENPNGYYTLSNRAPSI